MRIAIIGAGNVGGGLAGAATTAGHAVVLSASNPASAQETAAKTGATAVGSNVEAVDGADPWQSAFQLVGPTTAAAS
jgi:3-hydroxyisobutyrate dehydrogenase-like beta-hydroxyacid dehydrogenase